MNGDFWRGRRVLITGHTGFKGSWLSLWLQQLNAQLVGYALPPPDGASLFELAAVAQRMDSVYADVRDYPSLQSVVRRFQPEVIFHLAAQPLVRRSYVEPMETYAVNVLGIVHLLEAVRHEPSCRVVVNVTSDKCYENKEWACGYRESDPMGGHDPYSSSKGCAELVTAAYRRSFFTAPGAPRAGIASARAGNVVGGGDFSNDRIVPDFMAAVRTGLPLSVRNPDAIRPWQHVLEPLLGYLLLAHKLWEEPARHAESWNFGPGHDGIRTVSWVVNTLNALRTRPVAWNVDAVAGPHEAQLLMLDSTKARVRLAWEPRWTLEQALLAVTQWYDAYDRGEPLREVTLRQIDTYQSLPASTAPLSFVRRERHTQTVQLTS